MKSIFFSSWRKKKLRKNFFRSAFNRRRETMTNFSVLFFFCSSVKGKWKFEPSLICCCGEVSTRKFPVEFHENFLPLLRHDDELHTCEYLMRCKFSIVVGVDQQPVIYFHIKLFKSVGKSRKLNGKVFLLRSPDRSCDAIESLCNGILHSQDLIKLELNSHK